MGGTVIQCLTLLTSPVNWETEILTCLQRKGVRKEGKNVPKEFALYMVATTHLKQHRNVLSWQERQQTLIKYGKNNQT